MALAAIACASMVDVIPHYGKYGGHGVSSRYFRKAQGLGYGLGYGGLGYGGYGLGGLGYGGYGLGGVGYGGYGLGGLGYGAGLGYGGLYY